MRENLANAACHNALLEQDLPCIITCQVQHRDALIVAIFLPRIFAITHSDHAIANIHIISSDCADFFLAHGCGNSKSDQAANGNKPPWFFIKIFDQIIALVLCWPSVTLLWITNQVQSLECHPRKPDFLR